MQSSPLPPAILNNTWPLWKVCQRWWVQHQHLPFSRFQRNFCSENTAQHPSSPFQCEWHPKLIFAVQNQWYLLRNKKRWRESQKRLALNRMCISFDKYSVLHHWESEKLLLVQYFSKLVTRICPDRLMTMSVYLTVWMWPPTCWQNGRILTLCRLLIKDGDVTTWSGGAFFHAMQTINTTWQENIFFALDRESFL